MEQLNKYEGWYNIKYGTNLGWKTWIIDWNNQIHKIYIVYDFYEKYNIKIDCVYHYKDETKQELIDYYEWDSDNGIEEDGSKILDRRYKYNNNNNNIDTKYISFIN